MLTLNESFTVPDADHAWSVINDLNTLVPCVPGATVTTGDDPAAVKAQIEVRMGPVGMTFTGPVRIRSTDTTTRTVKIWADTKEKLGHSYATGDITISLGDGEGTIDAIANVGGKAAGMGEGVIVDVLTKLVRSFSVNVGAALGDAREPAASAGAAGVVAPVDVAADGAGDLGTGGVAAGGVPRPLVDGAARAGVVAV